MIKLIKRKKSVIYSNILILYQSISLSWRAGALTGTWPIKDSSPPASSSKTLHPPISLSRLAITEPADPAPTTMKS